LLRELPITSYLTRRADRRGVDPFVLPETDA